MRWMKRCCRCTKDKPRDEFPRQHNVKPVCLVCLAEIAAKQAAPNVCIADQRFVPGVAFVIAQMGRV